MELQSFFGLPTWLLVIVAMCTAVYWYLTRNYGYWKSKGIPEFIPSYPFQGLVAFFRQPFHELEMKQYEKYGRVYGAAVLTKPSLVIAEPHLLKRIFVKDFHVFHERRIVTTGGISSLMLSQLEGDEWKQVRSIISPSFSSGKIRKMAHLVTQTAETVLRNMLRAAEKGLAVDCKRYFGAFTMDTIASCAFGMKIASQEDENNPFVMHGRNLFSRNISIRQLLALFFPRVAKIFGITFFPEDTMKFFFDISSQVMKERRKTGECGNDFLQLIMDAQPGPADAEEDLDEFQHQVSDVNAESHSLSPKMKVLSEEEAVAQCIMFFLAGYDTTASALSFSAYCLALNPEYQKKLIQEVDLVWEQNKGQLDFDVVSRMQYLDAVISEVMRLYGVVTRLERTAGEDYEIPELGITIPKGLVIGIPIYVIHHDPEWYPDPDKFDPERFSPENKASRDPYVYLPFGAGPRNCIAMRFALMEVKICLATLLRHLRFTVGPETEIPLQYYVGQGLLQPKSVTVRIEKRSPAPVRNLPA